MREAEETVLHHLNYCTQYKVGETQMSAVLRVSFLCILLETRTEILLIMVYQ